MASGTLCGAMASARWTHRNTGLSSGASSQARARSTTTGRGPALVGPGPLARRAEVVLVDVEPAAQAAALVQRRGARRRRRCGTGGAELLGQRGRLAGQGVQLVAGAMARRQPAGQEGACEGRHRGAGGVGLLEEDALVRQLVQRRRLGRPVAVTAQAVSAGRVEGDEQDAGLLPARQRPLFPPRAHLRHGQEARHEARRGDDGRPRAPRGAMRRPAREGSPWSSGGLPRPSRDAIRWGHAESIKWARSPTG